MEISEIFRSSQFCGEGTQILLFGIHFLKLSDRQYIVETKKNQKGNGEYIWTRIGGDIPLNQKFLEGKIFYLKFAK